jgi:two-component system, chemotaxis family, chemotaxis protein CheY
MRRLLKSMMTKNADEIIEASDGTEAVELYCVERPDWIVWDIFMNPTGGLIAATEVKCLDSEARIIFVSSHTDKRTREAVPF